MIRIGDLQVDFERRQISQRGMEVRLSSRAFDILELLINANGMVVLKNEIMRAVWPTTIVEENNLQVHVATLRKILGRDRSLIVTVPGRGYRFSKCAPDRCPESLISMGRADSEGWDRFADRNGALIGRDLSVVQVISALARSELVTLVGAGGIGKTRLAREVARQSQSAYPEGVVWISFSSISEERFMLDAAAAGLPFPILDAPLSIDSISRAVRGKRLLIVLDSCEHIVDAAASLALGLRNAGCVILATSREPFRIPGEALYNVAPLDVPAASSVADDVLLSGAARLFIDRATALEPAFLIDARSLDLIGAICRAVDGIPLAIELAAARAARLGVDTLRACLQDRLRLLTGGCRTALPRHQTMRATLDWSYRLLSEGERLVLRRMAILVGAFTLDAVRCVAENCGLSADETLDAFCALVSKSMVVAGPSGQDRRYGLLEITREYALQQLDNNGERRAAATAHAEYLIKLIDSGCCQLKDAANKSSLGTLQNELDNLRAALEWSLSSSENFTVGVALAAVATPFFFELSLVSECYRYAGLALNACESIDDCLELVPDSVLKLRTAFATSLMYKCGPTSQAKRAWAKLYADASHRGNLKYQARALLGMWDIHRYGGEPEEALIVARRFCDLARRMPDATELGLIGMCVEGAALHYSGEHEKSRARLEAMLSTLDHSVLQRDTSDFQFAPPIGARATLARVMWSQGDEKNALLVARRAFEDAITNGNNILTCHVLVEAVIPIAILMDEADSARQAIAMLNKMSCQMSLEPWIACGLCYEQCVASRNVLDDNLSLAFASSVERLKLTGFLFPLTFLLCRLAQTLLDSGESEQGAAAIDEALAHCDSSGEQWFYAELCRVKGLALQSMGATAAAGKWFLVALEVARRQKATGLEIRVAASWEHWSEQRICEKNALVRAAKLGCSLAEKSDKEHCNLEGE